MSNEYLFPCECGFKIPVDGTQAGQTIDCPECSAAIELPSLLKMKQLEKQVAPESDAGKPNRSTAKSNRSFGQAMCFSGGMMLLVIGGVGVIALGGMASFFYSDPPQVTEEMKGSIRAQFDEKQPAELYDFYQDKILADPPGEFEPHQYLTSRLLNENFSNFAKLFGGLAGIGLLGIITSFLLPGEKTRKKKRTR